MVDSSVWVVLSVSLDGLPSLSCKGTCSLLRSMTSSIEPHAGSEAVRCRSISIVILPWDVVRLCLRKMDRRVRLRDLVGSISSAEIVASGPITASGWRSDVDREAKDTGKPVSWSRLRGRLLTAIVVTETRATRLSYEGCGLSRFLLAVSFLPRTAGNKTAETEKRLDIL